MGAAASRTALLGLLAAACTSIAADERTFETTDWRVTAINGQPTPPKGDYRLEFKDGRIGGRFGCNAFGGPYSVRQGMMTAGMLESTLMACGDPAGAFESEGFAILRQPMRMSWRSAQKLNLSNSAGSIELELQR